MAISQELATAVTILNKDYKPVAVTSSGSAVRSQALAVILAHEHGMRRRAVEAFKVTAPKEITLMVADHALHAALGSSSFRPCLTDHKHRIWSILLSRLDLSEEEVNRVYYSGGQFGIVLDLAQDDPAITETMQSIRASTFRLATNFAVDIALRHLAIQIEPVESIWSGRGSSMSATLYIDLEADNHQPNVELIPEQPEADTRFLMRRQKRIARAAKKYFEGQCRKGGFRGLKYVNIEDILRIIRRAATSEGDATMLDSEAPKEDSSDNDTFQVGLAPDP